MKRTGKILVALLAVIILLTSVSVITASAATGQPEKLYLTPSSNWKQSNARFAAYFFGNGETWVSMTYNSSLGVYEVTVPTNKKYPSVIFCRMNPSASANNWNNKWNQTADLTIPTNGTNHYSIKEGTWDKGGGTWSTLGSTCTHANLGSAATCTTDQVCLDCGDPVVSALGHSYNASHFCTRCNTQAPFTVAGSGAHLGTEWDTGNTANDMTFADGVYTKVYENVAAGNYAFKVVRDHAWGTEYPSADKAYKVDVTGSTVTITLKGTTVDVKVELPVTECPHENRGPEATCTENQVCYDCEEIIAVATGHPGFDAHHLCTLCGDPAPFTVAGTGAHLGTEWEPSNTANDMTYADGVWTKVYENVAKGSYMLKVARNHNWDVSYPGQDVSYTVAEDGSIVVITFNGSAVDVTVSVPHTCEYTEPATCLKGQHCKCGLVDPENSELGEHVFVNGICSVCKLLDLEDTVTIYFENNWAWPTVDFFYWYGENNNAAWPGVALTDPIGKSAEGHDIYRIEVPVGIDGMIFSGEGAYGRDQSTDIKAFSDCNYYYMTWDEATQTKPAVAKEYHTWTGATCETPAVCSVCQAEGVALGHDIVTEEAVAPTCESTGLTAGEYCTRCDHKVEQEEVAALGHDMVVDEAVAPTCESTGLTEGSHCSRCDHGVAQEEVPALGHDMVVDTAVAPTCESTGLTEGSHCTRCDHKVEQEEVPALGHDMVVDTAVAPTCESTGLTEGSHCTRCDHKIAQEEVAALGHNAGEAVVENKVAPNCTEDGSHDEVVYCTVCGDELSRNTVTDAKLNHKASDEWVKENEVAPTCENKGSYDLVLRCSVCGEELDSEKVDVDALGHKAGDPVVENSTAASCGAAGSYDEVVYCTVCDKELSRTTHTVDATPHSYKATITANPSCTEAGVKTFTCSVCGDSYTEAIDALGHELTTHEAKAPTCTAIGWDAYETCSRCDHTTYNELPKLKHSYEAVVTDPTCTATGYTTNTCSACGATYISGETSALGHDMVVDAAVAPTCESTGLTEGSHCTRCDHGVAQEEVAALGHDMVVDAAVAPTCESTGLTEGSHCTRCDHKVEQEEAAALGHDMVVDAAVAPTCTTAGLTEGSHCTRCDNKVAQEEVAALGHEFDTYKSICSVCYAPNPDYIVNTIDVTKENKLICNKYHLVGDLGPYEFITFKIENAGHYKFVGAGLAFTIYTIPTEAPGADFTAGTGASWAQYVFTEADLEPGTYWIGLVYFFGEGEYTVTVEYTAPHSHSFVDGKCECGAEDPNYVPPHEHDFVDGKCECGEEDPNYVPPHEHNFVNGECECGEKDPNYVAPGEDKPSENPGDNVPELTLIQKILKAITDFFKNIKDFFARIFKK